MREVESPGIVFPLVLSLIILGGVYYVSTQEKEVKNWAANKKEELQQETQREVEECEKKENHFIKWIPMGNGRSYPTCERENQK